MGNSNNTFNQPFLLLLIILTCIACNSNGASPGGPINLVATAISSTSISLTWAQNTSTPDPAAVFTIEHKGGLIIVYTTTGTSTTTTYIDTGLTPNTVYFYRVKGANAGGTSPYSDETSTKTFPVLPPIAPTNFIIHGISTSQITLSWQDTLNDETSFTLERKTGIAGTYIPITTIPFTIMTYTDTGLTTSSNIYYYRVKASNMLGDSPYSNEVNSTAAVDSKFWLQIP